MKLWAIVPELIVGGAALGLVPVAGWVRGQARVVPSVVASLALTAAAAVLVVMLGWGPVTAFEGGYAVDGLAVAGKLLVVLGALVSTVVIAGHQTGRPPWPHAPVAVLFATLGALGVCSSNDLALLLLFLQMTSMAGYVLIAMVRGGQALEAALKYFVYGAVVLAVMAYGLTFLYGLTGSLQLDVIGPRLAGADPLWVALAFSLVLAGLGFEILLVPFHVWAPDVLEGASAPVAGLLSVLPKVAAFVALLRLLTVALPGELVGWPAWIAVGAVATMTVGNLAALRQDRMKRLLAWSSVAQAGYVLVAVAVASRTDLALQAVAFQLAAYVFMNLGAFAVVARVERETGHDELEALRGLGEGAPFAAVVLALSLLSLAGLPPLGGFVGKVLVLRAAVDGGMGWLAVVAAVNMVVGLYVYARVLSVSWLSPGAPGRWRAPPRALAAGAAVAAAGTLLLGIVPQPALTHLLP